MENSMNKENYKKLLLMLFISFCVMYAVMFLNVDKLDHVYLSLTRMYMSLLMVAPMAVLMLILMRKMYSNKKVNTLIILSGVAVFIISLTLLRTQTPIGDRQYMKAMIPHHSSAILTSKHADIQDAEVRELSRKIIASQEREILQMKAILERMENEK
ncbi:MAG: DUF305 domain-containing protein [Chitinophagaceae bacterium]|nr:DUF305 domain-containing protein [Chitinophagaceae bacterium]